MSDQYATVKALTAAASSCGWRAVSAESNPEQITLIARLDGRAENIRRDTVAVREEGRAEVRVLVEAMIRAEAFSHSDGMGAYEVVPVKLLEQALTDSSDVDGSLAKRDRERDKQLGEQVAQELTSYMQTRGRMGGEYDDGVDAGLAVAIAHLLGTPADQHIGGARPVIGSGDA